MNKFLFVGTWEGKDHLGNTAIFTFNRDLSFSVGGAVSNDNVKFRYEIDSDMDPVSRFIVYDSF